MKISCKVVEDLLPLYHDEVCSEETCVIVGEHLTECESCSKELEKINEALACPKIEMDTIAPLKGISTLLRRDKMKSFFKGTLVAAVACILLFGCYYGLTRWKIIPVSSDVLQISNVSMLSDGRIIYHLNVTDKKDLYFIKFTTNEDGSYYMTPMRSVIETDRTMESGLFNDFFLVDVSENNAYQQAYGDGIEITSVYLGSEDDGILIWEKGMDLPAASPELEKMVFGNNPLTPIIK
ncbi:MAG: zf-HC2 domain-containing protein [Turicibacter sp.]